MTMKKAFTLFLLLAMLLAVPAAQAAPARSLGAMDLDAAQLEVLWPMLEGLAQAAWQQGVRLWEPGEIPPHLLQQAALAPHPGEDIVGVYIYEVRRTPDQSLLLQADVYRMHGIRSSVEEAPEDSLTWLCGMETTLRQQEGQPDRWVPYSLRLSSPYAAQHLRPYRGEEFELAVPDFFVEEGPAAPGGVRFVAPGSVATLTVQRQTAEGQTEQAVMQQLAQQNPVYVFSRQFDEQTGAVLAHAPGDLAFALVAGEEAWILQLRFPVEREREYSLYFEFLCNSFLIDEVTVG
jgi:hypothetical protein